MTALIRTAESYLIDCAAGGTGYINIINLVPQDDLLVIVNGILKKAAVQKPSNIFLNLLETVTRHLIDAFEGDDAVVILFWPVLS